MKNKMIFKSTVVLNDLKKYLKLNNLKIDKTTTDDIINYLVEKKHGKEYVLKLFIILYQENLIINGELKI